MYPKAKLLIIGLVAVVLFLLVDAMPVLAEEMLPKARIFYRPDGGVSIMHFLASACALNEGEAQCMDRIMGSTPDKDLPYDDILRELLPVDRKDRDKWRGEKGRGIWVDTALVTKNEKLQELTHILDEELGALGPNAIRIARLQRNIEILKQMSVEHNLLTVEQIFALSPRENVSFAAMAVSTVSDLFADILGSLRRGFLALKQLATDALKVGTSEKPSGITIYDQQTKTPYCLVVNSGQVQNIPGECGAPQIQPSIVGAFASTTLVVGLAPVGDSAPQAPGNALQSISESTSTLGVSPVSGEVVAQSVPATESPATSTPLSESASPESDEASAE